MDLSAAADAARRLTEAFEASQTSEGGRLVGTGERSSVPQELAQRFRELMEQPTDVSASAESRPAGAVSEAGWRTEASHPVESANASDLKTDTPAGQNLLSPEELLRTQFSMNMEHFTAEFFSNFQDQVSSQLEEQLKSRS